MTTFQSSQRPTFDVRSAIGTIVVTIISLVAIGVAVTFIVLTSASTSQPVAKSGPTGADTQLIHFYGTGAPSVVRHSAPTRSSQGSVNIPAEHFYGAQP